MTDFIPLKKMWERVEIAREDSDSHFFDTLLLLGEMIVKMGTASFLAGVVEDRSRARYGLSHKLVRATGLGGWTEVIDEILVGPISDLLLNDADEACRQFTESSGKKTWQYKMVESLNSCLSILDEGVESLPTQIVGRRWFDDFKKLRNRTRGHGAITSQLRSRVIGPLEDSLRVMTDSPMLWELPWAYLHQNLSGKYRITSLSSTSEEYEDLKRGVNLPARCFEDGVYVVFGGPGPCCVELLHSDADALDFWLPNGGFNGKTFDTISYITGDIRRVDSTPYLATARELPPSETHGIRELDIVGSVFTNTPPSPAGYVPRLELEEQLLERLRDDRHPVVTLSGRGGIGKTWTALAVLRKLAEKGPFDAILWFSARDIDLTHRGATRVKPDVLTESDIAASLVELMDPNEAKGRGFDAIQYVTDSLTKSPIGGPILFVFDNFETVRNLFDVYSWLDSGIRLPNKMLFTTRKREFKGDYPIEVQGMSDAECGQLIDSFASAQGICKHRVKSVPPPAARV